jgi:predicted heme/steroid binding protein
MRKFTLGELARFNGLNGAPIYIAYEGKVYDASSSWQWQRGRHQVVHPASVDYTDGLGQAPHRADLLERVPVIGILVEKI